MGEAGGSLLAMIPTNLGLARCLRHHPRFSNTQEYTDVLGVHLPGPG